MTQPARPDLAGAFSRLLTDRWSCRGYLPSPIPRETILQILALAQRTPSWCNTQPWQVSIVSGQAIERLRADLSAHAAAHPDEVASDIPFPREYPGVYRERRRECGFQLYESVGVQRGDRAASARQGALNFRFFDAPHVALVTSAEALGPYGAIDCGAYVNNFMLAAQACGVANIAQAALAQYADYFRERLGFGADRILVCGISFGYADPSHPANGFRTSREQVAKVVSFLDE
ncbi:Nitroreductase family protein [Pigmentiphaga humi]|uniref:Nitroreductase family protein n=1 Tax=Pigmentiphaga humi TaxID=2478468 RepID=A0A3P4B2H6_9BURK|nr:nitroreductase [Pigmentiphaga humi]VCU70091.1 Nitroreductase family protein [Pigmentiphaga humi]